MDYQVYRLSEPSLRELPCILDAEEELLAARRGEQFRFIRSLLKRELAGRCGMVAADIHLDYGPHGKPCFRQAEFNLSHSGDCLCMAFHHTPIGVDVEQIRRRPMSRLAPRFMAPEQLEAFLSRGSNTEEFFFCWCAAEALVKQAGDTIWNVQEYPFRYECGEIIPLFGNAPQVQLFSPLPGYCGAVAYHP